MDEPLPVAKAAEVLLEFLKGGSLTNTIAQLEYELEGQAADTTREAAASAGITTELLVATMVVRGEFGRMSDLIHASAIVLALPHLLEPGEHLKGRPSLAAGNDPMRPFDLETQLRIAEFKLSLWGAGSNATRKRQTFKDLVGLAMDASGRRPQLYVMGSKPARFLRSSKSTPAWALNRSPESLRARFVARYGTLDMPIAEYTGVHANHVEIVDLAAKLPHVFSILQAIPASSEEDEEAVSE